MTTSAQAIQTIYNLLSAWSLPSDWRYQLRDVEAKIYIDVVSPRYPGTITMTDIDVRAYEYYERFGVQTSPKVSGDAYGSAVNSVRYMLSTSPKIPDSWLQRITAVEANINYDELRRQKAIDDAVKRAEDERQAMAGSAAALAQPKPTIPVDEGPGGSQGEFETPTIFADPGYEEPATQGEPEDTGYIAALPVDTEEKAPAQFTPDIDVATIGDNPTGVSEPAPMGGSAAGLPEEEKSTAVEPVKASLFGEVSPVAVAVVVVLAILGWLLSAKA